MTSLTTDCYCPVQCVQVGEWHDWAFSKHQQGLLTVPQVEVCSGPARGADVFDRVVVGSTSFACTRLEESKKAKDSVVLLRDDGNICARRVQAFLSHTPPGAAGGVGVQDDDINLAYVHWYAFVPDDQPPVDPVLGCPVFGARLVDKDLRGNMCLVEKLLPHKFAALPFQHGGRNQVVIVTQFADFMDSL